MVGENPSREYACKRTLSSVQCALQRWQENGKIDIPVVFAWVKPPRVSRAASRTQRLPETPICHSKKQQPGGITRKSSKEAQLQHSENIEQSAEDILKDIQDQQPELEHQVLESMVAEYEVSDSSPGSEDQSSNIPEKIDVATNTCHYLDEDVGIQNVPFTLETDVQATVIMDDASVQAVVATEDVSTETSKLVAGVGVMTDDLEVDTTPFYLEAMKEDEKAITFYTGFTSYMYLMICFNFLDQQWLLFVIMQKRVEKKPPLRAVLDH